MVMIRHWTRKCESELAPPCTTQHKSRKQTQITEPTQLRLGSRSMASPSQRSPSVRPLTASAKRWFLAVTAAGESDA